MRLVWGDVESIDGSRSGLQMLSVRLDTGHSGDALCYPDLSGPCAVGERVLLNTTAVDLALGTGGKHFVVARGSTTTGVALDASAGGHIMKLRYTPMQVDVLSVEAQESPNHEIMAEATDVCGMPVVCCGLHSQVPLVAAAVKGVDESLRVAYVMTDQAALPIVLSDVIAAASDAGLIDTTITCGQSFGGRIEAINLHSGLLAARYVAAADVVVVAIGPGVAGTATPFGHGGVAQGEAINAAHAVGGSPVACLRMSFADARERHRGVSHHSLSALGVVALAPAVVPVPDLPRDQAGIVDGALVDAGVWLRHTRADVSGATPDMCGVEVRSMGRAIDDDPAFFAAAFAAGQVAGHLAQKWTLEGDA